MQRKCRTRLPIAGPGFHASVLTIRNVGFCCACCPISLFLFISRLIKPRLRRFIDKIITLYRHIVALNFACLFPSIASYLQTRFLHHLGFSFVPSWPNTRSRDGGLGLPSMGAGEDGRVSSHSQCCVRVCGFVAVVLLLLSGALVLPCLRTRPSPHLHLEHLSPGSPRSRSPVTRSSG